jgi:hypothetical protein
MTPTPRVECTNSRFWGTLIASFCDSRAKKTLNVGDREQGTACGREGLKEVRENCVSLRFGKHY